LSVGGSLTLPIWFFGLMVLFELDAWETWFLVIVNWILNTLFIWLLLAAIVAAITHGRDQEDADGINPGGFSLAPLSPRGFRASSDLERMHEIERKAREKRIKDLAQEREIADKYEAMGATLMKDPNDDGLDAPYIYVSFTNSRATDADLADLKVFKSLKVLEFGGSQITDRGMVHVKGLTTLQQVYVRNSRITAAGVRDLQQALPKLQIVR
jgi:hypothetical protein